MTQVLKIENLSGGYNRKKIIENINIEIPKGSITALIGLNGAGKSTTIKHILGLLRPMDGEIKVNGITIRENNEKYRKSISYIPESPVLYDELTLEEHINLTAMAYFSKGMKQKVMIICSFLVEPNLYIIDEPFLGLDPIAINDLINLMCEKRDNGASILMSTHILATAEKYCDNFIIIHEGKILASGKLSDLRKEFNMPDASLDEIYLALTTRGKDE